MELLDYEKKHLEILRPLLAECTVLLKSNGDFPLEAPGKIAVYGSGARKTIKGGTGSGEVNGRVFVNVEQGLNDAGFTVTSGKWLDSYENAKVEAHKAWLKELRAKAKKAHKNVIMMAMGAVETEPEYSFPLDAEGDVAIYVLSRNSGEGNDRVVEKGDVLLTDTETRDIKILNDKYAKFMLVLNVGGPVDLSTVSDVKNILVLSQLGVETGGALADILLGKENPSGKLTTTWSAWKDYKEIEFGDPDDTHYTEGVYVGYRYFDSVGKKALFPFGYGSSYTTFSLAGSSVSVDGSKVTVKTTVTNTGSMAGKEVVQVYVSVPAGKLDQPYQTLAAFVKTSKLAAGSSEEVCASFDLSDIASYSETDASWILEAGKYVVRVGNSSVCTTPCAVLELAETISVLKAKNVLGKSEFAADWKPENPAAVEIPADVPVISIASDVITTTSVAYDSEYPVDDEIKALTDEEVALLNTGNFHGAKGALSAIGEASTIVAGAAGEISRVRDFPASVMADGPAGLRLAQKYYTDAKGSHSLGSPLPESMSELLGGFLGFILKQMTPKAPKNAEVKSQWCTAIPIGTAIASSWNTELAEACGDIVGDECERMNVNYWLAPALNIHRSILCGRNFEYFSEDPLIAGRFAGAITAGVQKHKGCGTTIKHYAANNQETNRYGNNAHVSERAMREIYLRGFGICVRETQPKSVMTSYNLLNGIHTSENRGLIEDILRSEFGFKGVVMTDWVISMMVDKKAKYRSPDSALVAAAGNDLMMPGNYGNWQQTLKGLKEGKVTRKQLDINATRVIRMAKYFTEK